MSRIRKYECPKCGESAVVQLSKNSYVCNKCKSKFKPGDIDKTAWEDSSGDMVTTKPVTGLEGDAEKALEETIAVQRNAAAIVALIPEATRHLYAEDDVEAAVQFYAQHKDYFE